jgi:cell wall-associated NlpC family hydrolase
LTLNASIKFQCCENIPEQITEILSTGRNSRYYALREKLRTRTTNRCLNSEKRDRPGIIPKGIGTQDFICMVTLATLQIQFADSSVSSITYETTSSLNLCDSSEMQALATQARVGLRLQIQPLPNRSLGAVQVVLCEDDYPGWMDLQDLDKIQPAATPYHPPSPSLAEIQAQIPNAIAFAQAAMTQPNIYLWGGTIGPNYDCSGLVQHAFSTQGIWLPRDAYQQESFVQPITNPGDRPKDFQAVLEPGDLIFFGTPVKATHVAIYLGNGTYIHSSGKDQGRNGIGIDTLTADADLVSCNYYTQVRGAGRVVQSYQPGDKPWTKTMP